MSKADYPYPEDEFDAISPDAPTGVHRAPRSAWSRWWPFVVVLVVVPVIAYGAVAYLSRTGDLPLAGGSSQEQEAPAVPPEDAAAGEGTGEEPPADAEPEQPATEEPPAPEPDLATPVSVLNGARVSGLAGRVAEELQGVGFTAVFPDNASGSLPSASTVFITSEDLRPTAELVASTVGIPAIEVAPQQAGGGITVVLVTDPDA
ncbi:LytR C-terminal domain-containing protein [Cellulomonas xiejunii]|uniref:LytR C-terminal domain-containing protein n=1 Tax=Cellulomonas xiejunii TaxID=2968083 RepID=A0ABY5KTK9_9CELL|nr:LytR C-terminal domain-containing protein [Cellulomonas xiejunii]MCC2313815.1 LytR C-terminal domain-containing protein [Cellulomonas xiejunii]MCC2322540.1 LytR C-terminal domain-containing protein [Cellulomonas xiejunii]UUI72577.1 LytR C-terminal domain-containing protein [Cellulomonas xiejunii]